MTPPTDISKVIFPLVKELAASRPRIDKPLFERLKQTVESLKKPPDSYQILAPLAERFVIRLRNSPPYGLNPSQQEQVEQTKAKILDLFGKITQISKERFEESIESLATARIHEEAFLRFDILSSFGPVASRVYDILFRIAVTHNKYDRVASFLARNSKRIEELNDTQKLDTLRYISTETKNLTLFSQILKEATITAAIADSFLIFSIATKNHEATSIFLLQRGILTADDPDRTVAAELREKLRPDNGDLGSFFEKCFTKPPHIVREAYDRVSDPRLWSSLDFDPYLRYQSLPTLVVDRFDQETISSRIYRKIDLHQMRAPIAFACTLKAINLTFAAENSFILIHGGDEEGGTTHGEKAILRGYFTRFKDYLPIDLREHPLKKDGSPNMGATFAERKSLDKPASSLPAEGAV